MNLNDKKIFIGTSGGINSAAIIVSLAEMIRNGLKPKEVHLFYVHINQHSPDTLPFVQALTAYMQHHFPATIYRQHHYDVLNFFKEQKMIPHPMASPCTRVMKTEPMAAYKLEHGIEVDLVGYVADESSRLKGMAAKITGKKKGQIEDADVAFYAENGLKNGLFEDIYFPIFNLQNEDCFKIVKDSIGWYPKLYDTFWTDERILPFLESMKGIMPEQARQIAIKYAAQGFGQKKVKRVFSHNNCLPCKNMQVWQFWMVKLFYPEYFEAAMKLCEELGKYYGRDKSEFNEAMIIYTSFGREDFEVGFEEQSCGVCAKD